MRRGQGYAYILDKLEEDTRSLIRLIKDEAQRCPARDRPITVPATHLEGRLTHLVRH